MSYDAMTDEELARVARDDDTAALTLGRRVLDKGLGAIPMTRPTQYADLPRYLVHVAAIHDPHAGHYVLCGVDPEDRQEPQPLDDLYQTFPRTPWEARKAVWDVARDISIENAAL